MLGPNLTINYVFWLIAIIVFIIAEVLTVNLVSIWFMLGGLVALGLALAGLSATIQVIAFIVVSAISLTIFLCFIRPKFNAKELDQTKTNADRIIGQEAEVIASIDPLKNVGQIRVKGQIWSASSDQDKVIPQGSLVVVTAIKGVKAYVIEIDKKA